VDDAAVSGEIGVAAARRVLRKRDADFEVGANGDVEACNERSAAAAKILAGGIFFEGEAAGVTAANFERQADSDSTFRALPRYGGARERDHGLGLDSIVCGNSALEETFDTLEDFRGRARRMYDATKLAAVPHAMSKPAANCFILPTPSGSWAALICL